MLHFWGNIIEAILWFAIAGLILARRGRILHPRARRAAMGAALFFAAFGVTDLVETRTGAWYRPPSLLVANIVCVAGLAACGVAYARGGMRA